MSVTTTQNPIYYNTVDVLRDYQIHHSNADPSEGIDPTLNEHPIADPSQNPHNWPQDHRRVPDHRPINRNVDLEARGGNGRNGAEATFVYLMLNGCRINSNFSILWRNTFRRFLPSWFHYKIGGEW